MYYRTVPSIGSRGSGCSGRLIMAAAIALFSSISYFGTTQKNPTTGETQHISITPEQEIADLHLVRGQVLHGFNPLVFRENS